MPFLQLVIHDLNAHLAPGQIENFDTADFDEAIPLRDIVMSSLGVGAGADGLDGFLNTAPHAVSYAFKAILRSAASRRQPVTLVWMPGYEWELTVTDTADATTPGGISVLVRSRYPGDPSPVPAPHGGNN